MSKISNLLIMSKIKLATSKLTPFGHRVEMLMIEKKISYEKIEVDLGNKPDWFVKDSPLGKAPILYIDDKILFESIAICEYLEEIFTDKKLHPQDPYQKAWNRGWMEFCNGLIASIFALAFAQDEKNYNEKLNEFFQKIAILEKHLISDNFFNGNEFSLIDIFFTTAFVPINLIQQDYGIELISKDSKLFNYQNKLLAMESIKQIVPVDYNEIFKNFLIRKKSYLIQNS